MKKNSYIIIALVVLVFGIWTVPKIADKFSGHELIKFEQVPNFQFTNQDNVLITNKSYENKVYIVEFFFTTCPSICPIMNQNMVKLTKKIII